MTEDQIDTTRAEVMSWFFEDYLPRWVAAATGAEGPEFIHGYWGTPMHVTGLEQSFWCLDDAAVLAFLDFNYAPLREGGYSHTVVPDRRVFVYSTVGAAIEVIWSRRSADDVEIQRWATHFEVAKSDQGWRVIGVQATATDRDSLDEVWSRQPQVQVLTNTRSARRRDATMNADTTFPARLEATNDLRD